MGTMHYKIFRIVIDSLMGASSPWMIIPAGMYIAGLWRLLEKSGIKGWWALVPCVRIYQLGRCAGRVSLRLCSGSLFLHIRCRCSAD